MESDLLTFIQRFELLAFFAGYPLFYALVFLFSEYWPGASVAGRRRLAVLVPIGYAMVGTLFGLFFSWAALLPSPFPILP